MAADAVAPPPPGFEVDAPTAAPPPPPGFELDTPATPKKQAELKSYDPSLRERFALFMRGDSKPGSLREYATEKIMGSPGLGKTGIGAVDFLPTAPIFAGNEMQRAAERGDIGETVLDAIGTLPAVGAPVANAAKTFVPRGYGLAMGLTEASRAKAAAGKVAGAAQTDYAKSIGAQAQSITPQQLEQDANAVITQGAKHHQDVRLMDVGGEATRGEARRAANVAPGARGPMRDVIEPRFESQSDRTIQFFKDTFANPEDAAKIVADLKVQARATNAANYKPLWGTAAKPTVVDTPGLVQMMSSKFMKDVEKEAAERWEAMRLAGNASVPATFNGARTLQYWDQIKRVIGDKIDSAGPEAAKHLTDIKNAMVNYLDQAVPKYKTARGEAANFFKQDDAISAGQAVVKGPWTPEEIKQATAKMKPDELAQFQAGFLSDYIKKVSFEGDKRNILGKIMNSPGERAKIEAVLGKQKTVEFKAFLATEQIMDNTRNAMGNSTTVRQGLDVAKGSAGLGWASAAGGAAAMAGYGNFKAALTAALAYGARQGQVKLDTAVAEKVAEMLLSKDPSVYAKGLKEVAKDPKMVSNLTRAAAVVAQVPRSLGSSQSQPQPVTTPQQAAELPPGTWVQTPDGRVARTKSNKTYTLPQNETVEPLPQ